MRLLPLLLLVACNNSGGVDPAELKLRDTSVSSLRELLDHCQHPRNKFDCGDSESLAKTICDREHLDKTMKSRPTEQAILSECAKVLPQIAAFPKQ